MSIPAVVGLSNRGIFVLDSSEPYNEKYIKDETSGKKISSIIYSPKGNYLAYRTDRGAEVLKCSDWSVVVAVEGSVKDMLFSPMDTYFTVWEMFVMNKENPQGKPNLHVLKSENGAVIKSFVQKNQTGWEPKWSSDENIFTLQSGTRVLIYENGDFEKYAQYIQVEKLQAFSVSPSAGPNYFVSIFCPGNAKQPSAWRVFQHPNYQPSQAVLSRSSFQADKAVFHWNRRGTNILTLTQTDVDKTGGSYYGKQSLSHGDVKGNSGNMVFSKPGPIHAISWNPGNWNEWIAVYGNAPAKATIFNAKCDPLFEFGTGAWNSIYFPPEGNHVLLGGFGNIGTGSIEVWDVRGYKKLGACSAPTTTLLQWDPRGECFITATTYPRLMVDNGYKIWHYTGVLMHKKQCQDKENLLAVAWQPGTFPKSELSKTVPKAIEDTSLKPVQAYRPPGAKNKPSTFTLHEHEKPHKPGEQPSVGASKAAIKQKEKREARKARKAEEKVEGASPAPVSNAPKAAFVSTGDPEKDKKIKNLNKKLSDIDKLKQQKAAGKQLEINQLAKIESEVTLLQELAQLKL